jgi:hypothetical protein
MEKEIKWLGPYAPTDRHADDLTLQELVRLRVENEKLRGVLQKIADEYFVNLEEPLWEVVLLARAALKRDK